MKAHLCPTCVYRATHSYKSVYVFSCSVSLTLCRLNTYHHRSFIKILHSFIYNRNRIQTGVHRSLDLYPLTLTPDMIGSERMNARKCTSK